jgi:hypothetical protein
MVRHGSKTDFLLNGASWKGLVPGSHSYPTHTLEVIGKLSQGLCLFRSKRQL